MTEKFFIGIGSVIAFGVVFKFAYSKVALVIKTYQNSISSHLLEAEKIKKDAEKLLKKYQQQEKELENSVSETISAAQKAADNIILKARESAKENAKKRVEDAKKKIDISGDNMLKELDKKFIGLVIDAVKSEGTGMPDSNKDFAPNSVVDALKKFGKNKVLH